MFMLDDKCKTFPKMEGFLLLKVLKVQVSDTTNDE